MEESVTVGAQVATVVTQNDGQSLAVVMVVTGRSRGRGLGSTIGIRSSSVPFTGRQAVNMVFVEDTERGQGKPECRLFEAFARLAMSLLDPRQVEDGLGHSTLGDVRPLGADGRSSHVFEQEDDFLGNFLGHSAT